MTTADQVEEIVQEVATDAPIQADVPAEDQIGNDDDQSESVDEPLPSLEEQGWIKNPLAQVFETMSDSTLFGYQEVINAEFGEHSISCEEVIGVKHIPRDEIVGKRRYRSATNEECAIWELDFRLPIQIDIRKNMRKQFASEMRKIAAKALKAAEECEQIEDNRDRKAIKDMVARGKFENSCTGYGVINWNHLDIHNVSLNVARAFAEQCKQGPGHFDAVVVQMFPDIDLDA